MALKKRFWEAAQNGLGLLCFCCVLDVANTVATPLYLYFQVLCQVLASYGGGRKSCDMLSRKEILFASLKKYLKNHQFIFLSLIFYTALSMQFLTFHMF